MSFLGALSISPLLVASVAWAEEPPRTDRPETVFALDDLVRNDVRVNDMFAVAQRVQVGEVVDDNVFAVAQQVSVGPDELVSGDLFVVAEDLHVEGTVDGDIYAVVATVRLDPGAVVDGDVFVLGEELHVQGTIGGSLKGASASVRLDGRVGGDIVLETAELSIGEAAELLGDLHYESPSKAAVAPSASIHGSIDFVEGTEEVDPPEEEPGWASHAVTVLAWNTWRYLSALLVGMTLLVVVGLPASRPARALSTSPGSALGIGFLVAVVLPFLAFGAALTIVGLPLAVLIAVGFCMALYVGQLVAAHAVGDAILGQLRPGSVGSPYISFAVGLFVFALITKIPWIGSLIWLFGLLAGLGGIAVAVRAYRGTAAQR